MSAPAFEFSPEDLVRSDGATVWVDDPSGGCLARFGRLGIDIHKDGAAQARGEPACLYCTHEARPSWPEFVAKVLELHGVTVEESHRPAWVRP
jgi:hypothetical protein